MININKIFENNQLIMKLYSLYISEYNRSIDEVKVKSLAEDLEIDNDYAFYLLFINFLGLDIVDNKEHLNLANQYIRPYLKSLDIEEYKNNPYYKNIVPKSKKLGKWTLKYQTYNP